MTENTITTSPPSLPTIPGFIVLVDEVSRSLGTVMGNDEHWIAVRPEQITRIEPNNNHAGDVRIFLANRTESIQVNRDELFRQLAPQADPIPAERTLLIREIERAATRSGSRMWRLKSGDGEQVNVFGSESSGSNWELLSEGWQTYLESLTDQVDLTEPVQVTTTRDGQWNKLVSIDSTAPPPITPPEDTRTAYEVLNSAMNALDMAEKQLGSLEAVQDGLDAPLRSGERVRLKTKFITNDGEIIEVGALGTVGGSRDATGIIFDDIPDTALVIATRADTQVETPVFLHVERLPKKDDPMANL